MEGGVYITITGNSAQAKVAGQDVVYATNDDAIASKLDGSQFALGQSAMRTSGPGADPLASKIASIAADLQTKAEEAIAQNLANKVRLTQERAGLGQGASAAAGGRRMVNDALDRRKTRTYGRRCDRSSDAAVGSRPAFDPTKPGVQTGGLPVLQADPRVPPERQLLYRGMVRLEVSTVQIVADSVPPPAISLR